MHGAKRVGGIMEWIACVHGAKRVGGIMECIQQRFKFELSMYMVSALCRGVS